MKNFNLKNGFIASYILFGLTLLAIVTGTLVAIKNNQRSSEARQSIKNTIIDEALIIIRQIEICKTAYSSTTYTNDMTIGEPFNNTYPGTPISGLAADIQCKITERNVFSEDNPRLVSLWSGIDNSTLFTLSPPAKKDNFSPWYYRNSSQTDNNFTPGVYIFIQANSDTTAANILSLASQHPTMKNLFDLQVLPQNSMTRLISKTLVQERSQP